MYVFEIHVTYVNLIGTFDVIGVTANATSSTGLVCLFNPGSLAIGCLVYLTDTATGAIYCKVVERSLSIHLNMSLCPSNSSNGPLSVGVYSVEVYDIESDGSVLTVPAIMESYITVFGPSFPTYKHTNNK